MTNTTYELYIGSSCVRVADSQRELGEWAWNNLPEGLTYYIVECNRTVANKGRIW